MVDKYHQLPKDIRWHLIGHLQKNKVKYIGPFVHLIHSVDSEELLKVIQKEAAKTDRIISILLQIKIAKEDSKFGLSESDATHLLAKINKKEFPNIRLQGFMGMATFTDNLGQVREEFKKLKLFQQASTLQFPQLENQLQKLSMGMSGDYEIAIEEGATMVRIGSKIFGAR